MTIIEIFAGIFQGFRITAVVTALGVLFAVPFALIFGVAQYLTRGVARFAVTAVIEFWRSSAVIILLFVFYYVLPVVGVQLPAIAVSAMVLGLNAGGYGSQAVRAGLQSLDRGQIEAASALGLPRRHTLALVELPQALTRMAPTFINQFIQLIKGTALVSLVTLTDMTFRAKEIAELQYNPVGVYTSLLLAYFVICYPVTVFGRWVEQRIGAGRGLTSEL
ncbi:MULTISPECIES: amino acid ABC transporter permease [unclassified Mesorhizobium]|uniref:amino acid ABC transporter permease n=1 Tax=unclassified Mesorhizobium TaxID=325217 RepID=UPI001129CAAE|nr:MULTISPECIES: amino acid ABC transporter permease [unclassified Mesorhizobium]MBZ9701661.1 amino acid ABC transporter permease [Mesorhizobium sp. CO1-1-3]MBZ9949009.1 amino acid ABC transporter permease [Mesorhizobium sp. BR1-1-11]TPI99534.1 amino acid ABC transporter permease [Mesorhizobium sp. B2-8-1]